MNKFYFKGGYLYDDVEYHKRLIGTLDKKEEYRLLRTTLHKNLVQENSMEGFNEDKIVSFLLNIKEGKTSLATLFNILQVFYNPLLHLNDILLDNNLILDSNNNIIYCGNNININDVSLKKYIFSTYKIYDVNGEMKLKRLDDTEHMTLFNTQTHVGLIALKKNDIYKKYTKNIDNFLKLKNPFRLDRIMGELTLQNLNEENLIEQEKIHLSLLKPYIWNIKIFKNIRKIFKSDNQIEKIANIFFNDLDELTSRPNIIQSMIETNTIDKFYKIIYDNNIKENINNKEYIRNLITENELKKLAYYQSTYEVNSLFESLKLFDYEKIIKEYLLHIIFSNNQNIEKIKKIYFEDKFVKQDFTIDYLSFDLNDLKMNMNILQNILLPGQKYQNIERIDHLQEHDVIIKLLKIFKIKNLSTFITDNNHYLLHKISTDLCRNNNFDENINKIIDKLKMKVIEEFNLDNIFEEIQSATQTEPQTEPQTESQTEPQTTDKKGKKQTGKKQTVNSKYKINDNMKQFITEIKEILQTNFNYELIDNLYTECKNQLETIRLNYNNLINYINGNIKYIFNDNIMIKDIVTEFRKKICFEEVVFDKKKRVRMCKKKIDELLIKKIQEINTIKDIQMSLFNLYDVKNILKKVSIDDNKYMIGDVIEDNKYKSMMYDTIKQINTNIKKTRVEYEDIILDNLITLIKLLITANDSTNSTFLTGFGSYIVFIYIHEYINTNKLMFVSKHSVFAKLFQIPEEEIDVYTDTDTTTHEQTTYIDTIKNVFYDSFYNICMIDGIIDIPNIVEHYKINYKKQPTDATSIRDSLRSKLTGPFGNVIDKTKFFYYLMKKKYLSEIKYVAINYIRVYNAVPDCLETTIRNFINALMFKDDNFEKILNVPNLLEEVKEYYTANNNQYLYNKGQKSGNTIPHEKWLEIIFNKIKPLLQNKYGFTDTMWHDERPSEYQDIRANYLHFTLIISIILDGINSINELLNIINNRLTNMVLNDTQIKNKCIDMLKNIISKHSIYSTSTITIDSTSDYTITITFDTYQFVIYTGHGKMILKQSIDSLNFNNFARYINMNYYNLYKLLNLDYIYFNNNDFLVKEIKSKYYPSDTNNFMLLQEKVENIPIQSNLEAYNTFIDVLCRDDNFSQIKKSLIRCQYAKEHIIKPTDLDTQFEKIIFFYNTQDIDDTNRVYINNIIGKIDNLYNKINLSFNVIKNIDLSIIGLRDHNPYAHIHYKYLYKMFLHKKCIKKIFNTKEFITKYIEKFCNAIKDFNTKLNIPGGDVLIELHLLIITINSLKNIYSKDEFTLFITNLVIVCAEKYVLFPILNYYYLDKKLNRTKSSEDIFNLMIEKINNIKELELEDNIHINSLFNSTILHNSYENIFNFKNKTNDSPPIKLDFNKTYENLFVNNENPNIYNAIFNNLSDTDFVNIADERNNISKENIEYYEKLCFEYLIDIINAIKNPIFKYNMYNLNYTKEELVNALEILFNKKALTNRQIIILLQFINISFDKIDDLANRSNFKPFFICNLFDYLSINDEYDIRISADIHKYIQSKYNIKKLTLSDKLIYNVPEHDYKNYIITYSEINDLESTQSYSGRNIILKKKLEGHPIALGHPKIEDIEFAIRGYISISREQSFDSDDDMRIPLDGGSYYKKYLKYKHKYLKLKKII